MQMHAQALRCGSKVIQHCMRTLPFWEAWYAAHPNQVEPFSKVLTLLPSSTVGNGVCLTSPLAKYGNT